MGVEGGVDAVDAAQQLGGLLGQQERTAVSHECLEGSHGGRVGELGGEVAHADVEAVDMNPDAVDVVGGDFRGLARGDYHAVGMRCGEVPGGGVFLEVLDALDIGRADEHCGALVGGGGEDAYGE